MKRIACMAVFLGLAGISIAQTDSTAKSTDTVKVGNFVIIKKGAGANSSSNYSSSNADNWKFDYRITRKSRNKRNISTNWIIVDLGFANQRDMTDYSFAQAGSYFKQLRPQDGKVNQSSYALNTGKSSNFNLWFFMQKLNISKHVLNLKYGMGLEMYNFRYDTRLSYRKDQQPYVFNDSISFTKNKLFVEYLTVPLMLNFNPTPNSRRGFSLSAGLSAGYLIASRNKQISGERGKQKYKYNFDFEPWRVATVMEMGIGPVMLYGSYSLNRLQKETTRVEQYPYAVGIRFSSW
ncbi:MAG: hypothetical protein RLZZ28_2413 [Bacteroidota bacterium]|jgi:hypothetical protein